MKKSNIISILSVFLVWLMSCGNPLDPGQQPLDWMALTARINGIRQIVLVNFHDPSKFVFITNNDNQHVAPKFSDDKTQPLVLDKMMTEKLKFPVTGEGVVWSPGGN